MYPTEIEVNGKRYKLNTSYKNAIECFKIIEDQDISDSERAMAVMYMLLGDVYLEDSEQILNVLVKYLQRGKTEQPNTTPVVDIDYTVDEAYISASFMTDYKIDLSIEDMHWWKFIDLLNGLSPECIINRIRDIRTCDLNDYDKKTQRKLLKAREMVKLPVKRSKEEQEKYDNFLKFIGKG